MEKIKKTFSKFIKIIKKEFTALWQWAKNSKLNMSVLMSGSLVVILGIVIFTILVVRGGADNKLVIKETTTFDEDANQSETTMPKPADVELFTTEVDKDELGNIVTASVLLNPTLNITKVWNSDGVYYTQYSLKIENHTNNDVDGWALILRGDNSFEISDNWNAQYETITDGLYILPFPDNEKIGPGETKAMGFVITSYKYIYLNSITIHLGDKCETISVHVNVVKDTTTPPSANDSETTTKRNENSSETTTLKETATPKETTTEQDIITPADSETTTPSGEIDTQETSTEPVSHDEETTTPSENESTSSVTGQ
ncbi:MAG: hypothetical protein GX225_04625 [Clostridiales bacterium]|nr:hypothetical protein [Clostridiales bacterium]